MSGVASRHTASCRRPKPHQIHPLQRNDMDPTKLDVSVPRNRRSTPDDTQLPPAPPLRDDLSAFVERVERAFAPEGSRLVATLRVLAQHADQANRSQIGAVGIATRTGCNRVTAKRSLERLEQRGLIRREKIFRPDGAPSSSRYHLLLDAEVCK